MTKMTVIRQASFQRDAMNVEMRHENFANLYQVSACNIPLRNDNYKHKTDHILTLLPIS